MHAIGASLLVGGNFTMSGYLEGLDGPALERTLGFDSGRLSAGFAVAVLAGGESLVPQQIELKASTRWSSGLVGAPGSASLRELESLLWERGQDVGLLRTKACAFFARRGRNTPAKVIPASAHEAGMRYPDAEALVAGVRSGVPQFILLVPKRFVVVRVSGAARAI